MSDLVDRLRHDVHQLTKMVEQAKLAGPETGVRVKDPTLLLADLSEAADEIERLQGRKMMGYTRLVRIWDEATQAMKDVAVDVVIDLDELAIECARRTNRSMSGRSNIHGKIIVATQRK